MAVRPGGVAIRLRPDLSIRLEPRALVLLGLSVVFYVISAFVGNEWCYFLPAGVLAVVLLGIIIPIVEVTTIDVAFSVVCSPLNPQVPEIKVSIKRKQSFKLLSFFIPSGYLNAGLILSRRTWRNRNSAPYMVPIPDMIESLNSGFEARLKVPDLTRGLYDLQNVEISSCYPFAVAWCSRVAKPRTDDINREITVYPKLIPVMGNFHSRLSETDASTGKQTHSWQRPTQSMNVRGLREFTERDNLTHIHWPSSARSGKLFVREFEVESFAHFDVALDLSAQWNDEQFELAVTTAYSLLIYGQRQGFSPELYLIPAAESSILSDLLEDCPGGLAGEELSAELLARVSAIPDDLKRSAREESIESINHMIACTLNNRRNVIGVVPRPARTGSQISLVEYARTNNGGATAQTDASSGDLLRIVKTLAQFESEAELSRL